MIEKRGYPRTTIDQTTRIVIQDAVTGKIKDEGYARIHNISAGGALISEFELFGQGLPVTPFQVALIIEQGILKGIQTTCSVKWVSNGHQPPSCGLQFEKIADKHRARLWNLCYLTNDSQLTTNN